MKLNKASDTFSHTVMVDMEPTRASLITEVHKMEIVHFQSISTPLPDIPEELLKDLSSDQLLF